MSRHGASSPALDYIRALYAPEDALLTEIRQHLEQMDRAIQVGAEEGRILQLLLRLHGAKQVLEIGTLAGYSAIWMARALPTDGHLTTLERDPVRATEAQDFFSRSDVTERITLIEGNAHQTLESLIEEHRSFDAVFIDADKPSYSAYLDAAEQLLSPGGLVIADNTLLFGHVVHEQAPQGIAPSTWGKMRAFNQRLADSRHYDAVMLPTIEGLTIARFLG